MPSISTTLFHTFWQLTTFRLGPQDLPRSSVLLVVISVINLILSITINHSVFSFGDSVLYGVLEMLVLTAVTSLLLVCFSSLNRLQQTLTALMGCGAFISMLVVVVLVLIPSVPQWSQLAIFFWNLLVIAHVLRHALAVHFIAGFFCALGYAFALDYLIRVVGGGVAPAGA